MAALVIGTGIVRGDVANLRPFVVPGASGAPWGGVLAIFMTASFWSRLLAGIVLLTGLVGLVSALNAIIISASRILFSLGRSRMIAPRFARVHPRSGAPVFALGVCALLILVGVLAGKQAVIPIVNLSSTGLAFTFLITCLAVIRLRRRDPARVRPYRVPGGVATAWVGVAGSLLSLGLSIYQPYRDAGNAIPLEWVVLGLWTVLGALFWTFGSARRRSVSASELRSQIIPS